MIVTRTLRGTSDIVLVTGHDDRHARARRDQRAVRLGGAERARDFALLLLLGVVAMLAHVCVNRSLKLAPASLVVPYQYTLILWAMILGYLVFGDVPGALLVTGAAIIVAAGVFIFWRERAAAGDGNTFPPPAA
jgi:hypothetical protein